MSSREFGVLVGATIEGLFFGRLYENDAVFISTSIGRFALGHAPDCCEEVWLEDVVGDPADLVGAVVRIAEESSKSGDDDKGRRNDSRTWTFYRLVTDKADLTLRWCGESNGYYSEEVNFETYDGDMPTHRLTSKDATSAGGKE